MQYAIQVVVAGATLFLVGFLFHLGIAALAPGVLLQFENAALYRPWSGWTSIYMAVHPFGFGAVFAAGYLLLRHRAGLAKGWQNGFAYGAGVFLVGSLPVYLLVFASLQVSAAVVTFWIVQSACQYLAAGIVLAVVSTRLTDRST